MNFKYRERQTLKILLNRKSVTGNEFSDIFNISSRTIRTDIKNINHLLKDYGIEISSNTNLGYFLDLVESKKSELIRILEKENDSYKSEPEYRQKRLIMKLIQSNYVDLNDMANELYISLSSVHQDVKTLEHIIFVNNINLVLSKQGNTISIQSNKENMIRLGLALLLVDQFSDFDLSILQDLDDQMISFKLINRIIYKSLNGNKNLLGEHDLVFLTTYLFVTCSRILRMYKLTPETFDEGTNNQTVETILKELEKTFNLSFNKVEKEIIQKIYRSFSSTNNMTNENGELYHDILKICGNIDIIYGTRFINDQQLLSGIVNHINSYFSKAELNINFTEETVKEIKTIYPFAFNISMYFAHELEKLRSCRDYHFGENEIAFISVHIQASLERNMMNRKLNTVIIGSFGIGTTKLLETQIKKEFSNLEILASIAFYATDMIDYDAIDLVISTAPIKIKKQIPCIVVEVPLKDESIQAIKRVLQSKYYWSREIYPIIIEIPVTIYSESSALDFIETSLQRIEGKSTKFKQSFEAREKSLTTNIGRGIAMPHALFDEHFNYHLYFFYQKQGVQWGNSKVNLIASILITSEVREYMNDYMKLINSIYSNLDVTKLESASITKLYETIIEN
jgi:lichenan operon transcriptional antiterminator